MPDVRLRHKRLAKLPNRAGLSDKKHICCQMYDDLLSKVRWYKRLAKLPNRGGLSDKKHIRCQMYDDLLSKVRWYKRLAKLPNRSGLSDKKLICCQIKRLVNQAVNYYTYTNKHTNKHICCQMYDDQFSALRRHKRLAKLPSEAGISDEKNVCKLDQVTALVNME